VLLYDLDLFLELWEVIGDYLLSLEIKNKVVVCTQLHHFLTHPCHRLEVAFEIGLAQGLLKESHHLHVTCLKV
jgi:hypothetical protein